MTASDRLADALRRILADDPMDGGKYTEATAALAAYDAEKDLREAEREYLEASTAFQDWVESHTFNSEAECRRSSWEFNKMLDAKDAAWRKLYDKLLAARKAKEGKP